MFHLVVLFYQRWWSNIIYCLVVYHHVFISLNFTKLLHTILSLELNSAVPSIGQSKLSSQRLSTGRLDNITNHQEYRWLTAIRRFCSLPRTDLTSRRSEKDGGSSINALHVRGSEDDFWDWHRNINCLWIEFEDFFVLCHYVLCRLLWRPFYNDFFLYGRLRQS